MSKDEVLNRIRCHFIVRYNTLALKTSDGYLKSFFVDDLIYLCSKVFDFGYEQGTLDMLQRRVDKKSVKMDNV